MGVKIATLFVDRVEDGRLTFNDVPRLLKQQVADIIVIEHNKPELVPTEFGGTQI